MTKIILSGALGKMGKAITSCVANRNDCEIVAGVDIANEEALTKFANMPLVKHGVIPKLGTFTESQFNLNNATNSLKNQFKVQNFHAFDIEDINECICVSGALVAYLYETQKHALINITKIKRENNESTMMLDANAIRNLELVKTLRDGKDYGSLFWLLDKTFSKLIFAVTSVKKNIVYEPFLIAFIS